MCVFQCLNRHEQPSSLIRKGREFVLLGVSMPQSARATFKQIIVAENAGDDGGFNASIGTSNLQANTRSASILVSFQVSMPQSARATFKLYANQQCRADGACFNASIGTSNLQAP